MKRLIIILVFGMYCMMSYSQNTGSFTDPRDGKTYKTVRIGGQWIMAENLAYKPTTGEYWTIKNDEKSTSKYGYLYSWDASLSVAPAGWHVPTIEEWDKLHEYLRGYIEVYIDGINESFLPRFIPDFNLVFAGERGVAGFILKDKMAMFRSSTPYWSVRCYAKNFTVSNKINDKVFNKAGISIRLFKDLTEYDMWGWAKTVNSKQGYKDYLQLYQNSIYADSAGIMINKLQEQEEQNIENAKNAGEKIIPGVSLEEVISLLLMEESLDRNTAGGILVPMSVFPHNKNDKSIYSGNASIDGYDIVFDNGKVVSKILVSERLGSKKANFSVKYIFGFNIFRRKE